MRLSALGDVAMCVPLILAFKRRYPQWQVTVVTKPAFSALFSRLPGVSVLPADTKNLHKGLAGLWKLGREVNHAEPTCIADLHNVLRTRILRVFLGLSGIPYRAIDKGRAEKKRLTAPENKRWEPLKTTHERYADVFRALGFDLAISEKDRLPQENWPAALAADQAPKNARRIGIAPFAAHEGKCYPEAQMKEVLRILGQNGSNKMYLFGGGKSETLKLAQWESEFTHCVALAGKASFSEELALISNLHLMISMDSGNGHLAALYGIPVVTLWGVTHPYAGFAPIGQPASHWLLADRDKYPQIPTSVYGNKWPPGYEKAMETITPEQVCTLADAILDGQKSSQATTTGESDRK